MFWEIYPGVVIFVSFMKQKKTCSNYLFLILKQVWKTMSTVFGSLRTRCYAFLQKFWTRCLHPKSKCILPFDRSCCSFLLPLLLFFHLHCTCNVHPGYCFRSRFPAGS